MTSSTTAIADRIAQIQQSLPTHVRFIAVTKQVPVEAMRAAYDAGLRDFGESKVQEALPKQTALQDLPDVTWHFIGHIQSNKAQKVVDQFDWIHSVDSLKLARRLNRLVADPAASPSLCLQVKPLPDPGKYGWTIPDLWTDLPELEQLTNLNLCGLMTILPQGLSDTEAQDGFSQVHHLADELNQQTKAFHIDQLSMGMSADYALAVEAGATMVRIGRTIFGERPQPT
jgi:hypothetical protein